MRRVLRLLPILVLGLPRPADAYSPADVRDPVPWVLPPFLAAGPDAAERWAQAPAPAALLAESADAAWRAAMDARTGVPGALRLTVPVRAPGVAPTTDREAMVAFATRHAAAFGVDPDVLTLPERAFASMLDGRLLAADFVPAPHGIPVEGARLSVRVSRGHVVLLESERLAPMTGLDPTPALSADDARARVLARLGATAADVELSDAGSLLWLPVEARGGSLRLVLAWRIALWVAGSPSFWEARVDARSGELLGLRDDARWACPTPPRGTHAQVKGGVQPRYPWEGEAVRGLPYARVRQGASTTDSDVGGIYAYPGGAGDSILDGVAVHINCLVCSNPADALAPIDTTTGDVDYGTGGSNTTGNGRSLKAERTSFYHGGRVRAFARKWLAPAQVPDGIEIVVNYNIGSCNGVYTGGRIILFPADGTCVNTGEHPSVIQHEWGHGLDFQTGPSGDWSEGMADHVDMLTHRDSRGAPGFYIGNTDGLREADETRVALKVWPAPECGGEVHCLGEVYNQADWHLATLLRADPRFGEETGWHLMESLFFNAVPQAGNLGPGTPGSVYEAYANVLDALFGDGNVLRGVPLASHLNAAFAHHGLAPGSPYAEEPYPCATPPVAPALTASVLLRDATTGRPRVTLSWTDPVGVAHDVLRSETGAAYSKLELATVPAGTTTYVDTTADPGATYVYAVMPQLPSGCYARMDALLTVTVEGGALGLRSVVVDPAGDGAIVPGETVDVVPTVENLSPSAQSNVVATLEPGDPLVTIGQATSTIGALAVGAFRAGGAWRVTLSPSAPCDGTFELPVRLSSDQGCSMAMLTLSAGAPGIAFAARVTGMDDPMPGANGNGRAEPGEIVDLAFEIEGIGSDPTAVASGVTGTLTSLDPRVTVLVPGVTFGDVPMGSTAASSGAARLSLDPSLACGLAMPLRLDLAGANGCWSASFTLLVAGPRVTAWEDPEQDSTDWSVSGDATGGRWRRTDPLPVIVGGVPMPDDDATPDPGHLAWVTEARSETPGLDDVDGGCTSLTLALAAGAQPRMVLSYWRALGWEGPGAGEPGDGLVVEAFDPGSGQLRTLETLTSSAPFERVEVDLEDLFGYEVGSLRVEFRACDAGTDSLVEAVVDEVRLEARPCQGQPSPQLVATAWAFDDTAGGNGNGALDPGETLDVRVQLENVGAAEARAIAGTLRLFASDPGVTVTFDTDSWLDLAVGASGWNVASFRVSAAPDVACGAAVELRLDVAWTSDTGPGLTEVASALEVGALEPAATAEVLARQAFDAVPVGAWASYAVRGDDDWQLAAPQGLGGDPNRADTLSQAWGNDLGAPEPPFVRDGLAAPSSVSRLDAPPLDLSRVVGTHLRFARWLDVGPGDRARVLVDGVPAWESAAGAPLRDATWTPVDLDISALADGRAPVRLTWELETDAVDDGGGWTLDTVEIVGRRLQPTCGCQAPPPTPLGNALRVTRAGMDAVLDWNRTTSDGASFRVLRRVSARQLPATGSWEVAADQSPGRAWTEPDGSTTGPLVLFEVRPLNACGEE